MQVFQPGTATIAGRTSRSTPFVRGPVPKSFDAERTWQIGLGLLFAAAFAFRARYFGNPFMDVDEQFYLLVADRMLHGSLPYIDIWDRKPVGLFLLYAAIRLLGGTGIVQYQVVAALFAAGTSLMIALIARRISTRGAALTAAFAYVLALALNGGAGGQTPVFYNLPMAVAAWLLVRLVTGGATARSVRRHGTIAMLLVGVAMQIKYSTVFEGVFFGLALAALSWRASRRPGIVIADCLLWIAIAVAPTLLAFAWYAQLGQAQAFLYANFISIFERGKDPWSETSHDLRKTAYRLALFVVPILISEWLVRDHGAWLRLRGGKAVHRLIVGWVIAAFIGYATFGSFYNHYALPLLVPLAIMMAPAFAIAQRGIGVVLATLVLSSLIIAYPIQAARQERHHGDAADAAIMVAAIRAHTHGGCPYIFYGEPILYHLTGSCLPSRWAFPFHLNLTREAPALGVAPLAEVKRIMDARPPVVIDRLAEDANVNVAVQKYVRARLARDYRLVFSHPNASRDPDIDQVWALKR